ncbi:hypothetical protein [Shewanella sp. MTB7]|uniref:hypothetical protein n=1 Tax=Shewanella sp. MTB7 TaxID=2746932 RepID=UPI0022BA467B|nr:hypothetical protein [Shewanella sp. MTB7]WBJ94772.1 hypothetical protein HWQ47_23445 [Shewanella sp. MTB7]WBJ95720.1 hypothetical protein HWQ47_00855 [Shewanella sp. MTB7]
MNLLNSVSNYPPRPKAEYRDKPTDASRHQLACRQKIALIKEARSLGISVSELTGEVS